MRIKMIPLWAALIAVVCVHPMAWGQATTRQGADQGLKRLNDQENLGKSLLEIARLRQEVLEQLAGFEKLEKMDARRGVMAARAALVIGMPARGIPLMERALKEDPNGDAGLSLPFYMSGHFVIAALAKHSGDWERAVAKYEEILKATQGMKSMETEKSALLAIEMLYLAEAQEKIGKKPEAMATLEAVEKLPDQNLRRGGIPTAPYKAWARWNLEVVRTGKAEQSEKELSLSTDDIPSPLSLIFLSGGLNDGDLRRSDRPDDSLLEDLCLVIGASDSEIDRDCVLLLQGVWKMNEGKRQYAKGKPIFLEGMNRGGFVGVQHALLALMCMKELKEDEEAKALKDKLLERYPKMQGAILEMYSN